MTKSNLVKCCSVRVEYLTQITEKAYKVRCFDGSEGIVPVSQVFGQDYEVGKSDAYWIAEWVLREKKLQYSSKKTAWFDKSTGERAPSK
ncbi:MAG: hypothetical protein LBQ54_07505 [Planctomycetaceae bacterium]|nr:hypothetical protein [Planctomycetaceae bacterium]